MAYEGTKQGMQSFLAAKQAGAHPLAQHLNFKSALKEARIALKAKELENERNRAFQREENKLTREAAQTRVETQVSGAREIAILKNVAAGLKDPMKIYDKAVTIVKRRKGLSVFSKYNPNVEAQIKKEAVVLTSAVLADMGIPAGKQFGALLEIGPGETSGASDTDQEIDELMNLSPEEAQDLEFQ
jgi:hypothetical protein